MYESPIEIIHGDLKIQLEGEILKAVRRVGVNVEKEELLRALAYDRGQYDKGYRDGVQGVCMRILERLEEKAKEPRYQHTGEDYYVGIESAIEIVKEEM